MPELPEIQALAERLEAHLAGAVIERVDALSFSGLKSVAPTTQAILGCRIDGVSRRGKYLVIAISGGIRMLIHLAQAGRLDIETPAKATRPRGAMLRILLRDGSAIFVREHGHERNARWWLLAPEDDGPLAVLGPDVDDGAFAATLLDADDNRRIHTILRDQRFAAGVGRGYADDVLHLARISPFASLRSLDRTVRQRLIDAIEATLAGALEAERTRGGGLSAARLGDRFSVHNRSGSPCPTCGDTLLRVSYSSHEVVYCKTCQTGGRVYADRRLSRLLR
ncbi:MAG TPA: DNA-formamidopyrimidine glycosylase family protein [Acidimicrobiales bacterium]|nr:DNA-formamidopyrimidine glycosylase family protein [Acidimicrobiales bacterium]